MILPDFLVDHPDGEIRLTGHRIGLYTIVRNFKEGLSAEKMTEEYPSLSLDQIRRVIGFYLDNKAEVDSYVEEYRQEMERQEAASLPSPGGQKVRRLMEMLRQGDTAHAADPEWKGLDAFEKLRRLGVTNPREMA